MSQLTNIYYPQIFYIKESLEPDRLKGDDINSYLLEKIKKNIGDKCIVKGFVKKDSIKIVSRTIGTINTSHFNGQPYYHIKVEADICKPSNGDTITDCRVVGINKIGIFAVNGPLQIIVAAVHHDDTSFFDKIKIDDRITVLVDDYKFQLNEDNIKVVAKFISKK